MKLDYKVLWIEDNAEWLEVTSEAVERYLKEFGFVLKTTIIESGENEKLYQTLENSNEFDIIFVDYKLDGDEKGSELIKLIREKEIFAEVVFYSVTRKEELFARVAEFQLDGIFVSSRGDFIETVKKVIKTTIRKVLDLNNLRGIVLASTSVLDKKIFEIIRHFHDNNIAGTKEKKQFSDRLLKRVAKQIKKLEKTHREADSDDPWKFLGSTINFNSMLRIRTLRSDILEKELGAENPKSPWHTVYLQVLHFENDINPKRNKLAHEEETLISNGDGTFTTHIGNFVFDESTATELRIQLIELETVIMEAQRRL